MSTLYLMSHLGLWVLFAVQCLVILTLVRQVGLLNLRIAPAGARVTRAGPGIGEMAPTLLLQDLDDPSLRVDVSPAMESHLMLLFVSPNCAACPPLVPAMRALARESQGELQWALVSVGGTDACRQFRDQYGLHSLFFACSDEARERYQIGVMPYAVVVRNDGIVVGKGIVNQVEHLESLLEARWWRRSEDQSATLESEPQTDGAGLAGRTA